MPDNASETAVLTRQLEELRNRFSDFRTFRQEWEALINRRAAVRLDPSIAAFAENVDIQLPDLEQALHDHIKILMLSQARIDCVSLEATKDARKDVEDIRIWSAASWLRQDDGLWIDQAVAGGQVQHGVKVMRKHWKMPEEPDDEKLKDYLKDEDASDKAKNAAREAYFRDQEDGPFWYTEVGPYEVSWFPLSDPTLVIQESLLTYIEATKLTTIDGKRLTIDGLRKIAFVGEEEPVDEWNTDLNGDAPKVRLVIRDAKDPKTGEWEVTEMVYPDGGNLAGDGQELRKYANPLERSMYFIVPSGDERIDQTDPHLRYRPILYSLIVYVQQYNYLATLIAALAHKKVSDEDVYIDISRLTPEAARSMEEWGLIEGVGTQRRLVMRRPEPGSGEIAVSPTLSAWPNDLEPHLMLLLQETKEGIARTLPNRFLLGNANEEYKEAPATSVLNAMQAAGMPYGASLVKSSTFIKQGIEAEHRAIMHWDKAETGKETMKPYVTTTTGDEPLLKGTSEPAKVVTINAEKLKRHFIVKVQTKNETQAEKAQNDLMAYQDFNAGTSTFVQLLRRIGHDDPEHQDEELEEERTRKRYEPRYQQLESQMIETYFSALTGLNLSEMLGGQVPTMPEDGGGGQSSSVQKPRNAGPQMTPAPVQGPSGASNAVGAMM